MALSSEDLDGVETVVWEILRKKFPDMANFVLEGICAEIRERLGEEEEA